MKLTNIALAAAALLLCTSSAAYAQTGYPMLMSVHPIAAQAGQTSEVEVNSRYSMHGAFAVLVSGSGVSGEIATEMKPPEEGKAPPELTKIKVRLIVSPDALPGVRELRIATPRGISTVGQIVIVADPVIVEKGNNNTLAEAQQVQMPATICGVIEANEDVDFFKFHAEAGTTLTFLVQSMRLQDKIHDLQTHSDPLISLRNASGTTLAASDNFYAGDPLLSYRFQHTGDYFLEIRDVRYQGNSYWEYSIEATNRPFVTAIHPMGLTPGQSTTVKLLGFNLPAEAVATAAIPADAVDGPAWIQIPVGDQKSNAVPVAISRFPAVVEMDVENGSPATAQPVPIPAAISGCIGTEADIDCYVFEAVKGDVVSFEVIARRQQSALDSNVRILDATGKQLAENDDLQISKRLTPDSGLDSWTAPADGKYVIEIRDLHLRGGADFVYLLKLSRPEPSFELYLDNSATQLTPGTSAVLFANVVRKNGFTGEVALHVEGLPDGVTASCGRILAGKGRDGAIILTASKGAKLAAANITVRGTASHPVNATESRELSAVAVPYQETYQPGGGRGHWPVETHAVGVGSAGDLLGVKLSTYDVTLKPGESVTIDVTLERAPDFKQNVSLDPIFRHLGSVFADTLPPGVTMDAKTSKTLLTGGNNAGSITLICDAKAEPVEKQQVSVMANIALNFVMKATYSSEPLFITVVKPE